MRKKLYEKPTINIVKLQQQTQLLQASGVEANRSGYGTASTGDGTEQTWE